MEQENPQKEVLKINVMQVSMTMGTKLGLYIILVYAALMLSLRYSSLSILALLMLIGIPVVAFFVVRDFRNKSKLPVFPFPVAWMFSLLMFVFATVLSGMIAYLYLRFLDNGALSQSIMDHVSVMNASGQQILAAVTDPTEAQKYTETMDILTQGALWFSQLTSSGVAKELMESTLLWGNLFSIFISLLLMKRIKFKI